MNKDQTRRCASEALGTAFLVSAVIGSGIMGERLANGNIALALLANTIATGAALVALILTFGPISGAHFNPVITVVDATEGGIGWHDTLPYICAQLTGAVTGAIVANVMFGLPFVSISKHHRNGVAQAFSEFIATFGLVIVIRSCSRFRSGAVPFAVAAYITAAYWFTASTSFANPAMAVGRMLSDTFAGIRPIDVPVFVIAQFLGGLAATHVYRRLVPKLARQTDDKVGCQISDAARNCNQPLT